jgi:hypothetical protein
MTFPTDTKISPHDGGHPKSSSEKYVGRGVHHCSFLLFYGTKPSAAARSIMDLLSGQTFTLCHQCKSTVLWQFFNLFP